MELPVVVGLHVCERVTEDRAVGSATIWNRFTQLASDRFPSLGFDFTVFALFIDGDGTLAFRVEIERLGTGELVHEFPTAIPFKDRLIETPFHLKLSGVTFPEPGGYEVSLTIEDEPIARCRIQLFEIHGAGI